MCLSNMMGEPSLLSPPTQPHKKHRCHGEAERHQGPGNLGTGLKYTRLLLQAWLTSRPLGPVLRGEPLGCSLRSIPGHAED